MKNSTAKLIATSLGLGYLPLAPGSWGALGALLVAWFVQQGLPEQFLSLLILVILLSLILGIWACNQLRDEWGEDPSRVVIDESLGMWISLLFIPPAWEYYLAAFILFRFFDIAKPLGIRTIDQKLKGPLGVMLDDVLAGVYSLIILQLAYMLLP